MRLFGFFVVFFLSGVNHTDPFHPNQALAHTFDKASYSYPFKDPWVASIASAALIYRESDFVKVSLEFLPQRRSVPLLENRNKVSFHVLKQKSKAPLAFVLSGTGGSSYSSAWQVTFQFGLSRGHGP